MSPAAAQQSSPTAPPPTATVRVGMVGAGQLARMTHRSAIDLGISLRVLASSEADAAVRAGAEWVLGSADELADLRALAAGCDVVTFDYEGIPPELLRALEEEGVALAPGPAAKLLAQDKLHARRTLAAHGLPVPDFAHARTPEDVRDFAETHGWPIVAKAPRGGYDGRGVWMLEDLEAAAPVLKGLPDGVLLEPRLVIERELAVIVIRSAAGELVAYPAVETVQREAMCREIIAPAPVTPELAAQARDLSLEIAELIDATGVLAVELFVTGDGLLINELALRPHNSGHYTIEGCVTSQFEQHLRAVLGWPLGLPDLVAPSVTCVNVVGPADGSDPSTRLAGALRVPGAHVHLYGKPARPGRKLGHVTVCGDDPAATRDAAQLAVRILEGEAG